MSDARTLPVLTYLSMDPLTSTVGSSQVLAYVERLASRGLAIELVSFEHGRRDGELESRLRSLGVTWKALDYGRHGTIGGLGRVLRAAWALRRAAVVHARSDMAAASVMLARRPRWVWDVRSLWADQKVATGVFRRGSIQERTFRLIERRAAASSGAVVTLTPTVIRELDRRYGGVVTPKARVVTTCVDLDRFQLSPMPQGPTRILLAGTINRYYDIQSMLDVVAEFRRRRPTEFIVASPEKTDWEDELAAAEPVRVSATSREMATLIASCHMGLSICRDDAGVSLGAAMPTKIGEFLSCGRPVVVNPGLVDAADLISANGAGAVFGSSGASRLVEVVDLLEQQLQDRDTPQRCRSLASRHFDLERGVDQLLETYGGL